MRLDNISRYLHPRSAVRFWHTRIEPRFYDYPSLNDYYIDLRAKLDYAGPYDAAGIPVLDYFGAIGRQYNPCATAQWTLGAWQGWLLDGRLDAKSAFFLGARWLRDNLHTDQEGRGWWWYRFDFNAYGLRAPWASALAQAQGISALLRADRAKEPGCREAARAARNALLSPVERGGLLLRHQGLTILEEVVSDRPTAILDGVIFALLGLRDYCFVHPEDDEAAQALGDGLDSLRRLLPRYDLGYWSRADLYSENPPMPASGFYHRLHVAQLWVLYDLTGEAIFAEVAERWEKMAKAPLKRLRALANKVAFKLFHY
jgi:heparosan-N-sulfate-glucuronate 5-epimerase